MARIYYRITAFGATIVLALAACGTVAPVPPPPSASSDLITVPSHLSGGTVELRVRTLYPLGDQVVVRGTVRATSAIRGPLRARVVASGIVGEALVRDLAVEPLDVPAGSVRSFELVWDARDARGVRVPADDYGLVVDFLSATASGSVPGQATVTLQLH